MQLTLCWLNALDIEAWRNTPGHHCTEQSMARKTILDVSQMKDSDMVGESVSPR
ncbi:hypothetical protein VN12_18320 [Pirellula sp. SH-Sr6A]|nr:hypothetical protein VN12_18320 [Pirellula sp. SH-Sr6A]